MISRCPMKNKLQVIAILSALCLASCDEDTKGLGASLVPEGDDITVSADSCFAQSRTIAAPDSLLVKTTQCNLGRYTEPGMGATFQSGFLTQLNCLESYNLPDSVYGIGDHSFPEWFIEDVGEQKPYYANLRLYYSSFFGDSTNIIKIDVFELDRMIDANRRYYPDIDPSLFCDTSREPLASVSVSAWNYQDTDSLRGTSTYYPSITVSLPDSIAYRILSAYYEPDGKKKFANASSFMNNLCKGFYIRCTQGDGTMLYIDQSILQVNFKCIGFDTNDEPYMASYLAEFPGNSEVMQLNSFGWTGLDSRLNDKDFTWVLSPAGLLTEITLPVDEMKKNGSVLNSAQMCLSCAITPSSRFKPSIPTTLLFIRKDMVKDFFSKNSNTDGTESFVASYSTKYGTYTYNNIAAVVEKMYSDRKEWLDEKGLEQNESSVAAYASERPDWDKMVLIPVTAQKNSSNSVIGYRLDIGLHQVKLLGGPEGSPIKIKTINTHF